MNKLNHVAIIMDGNRRWAKNKAKGAVYGHRAGVDTVREIVKASVSIGLPFLSIFAFSTENKKRSSVEVKGLMELFKFFCKSEREFLYENGVKVKFIGDLKELGKDLLEIGEELENFLSTRDKLNLYIAINYSGRYDITRAVNKILSQKNIDKVTQKDIEDNLYTKNIPDPDLLIRTGGEFRISNYYLWQLCYSEFVFVDTFWPDFNKEMFLSCIEEYYNRKRRFGR